VVDVSWPSPAPKWVALNSDGSVIPKTVQATTGGLFAKADGRCLAVYLMNLGICSITRAELRVVVQGLQMDWELGYRKIQAQLDSQAAIQLVLAEGEITHQHSFEVKVEHVYLEGNWAADYLACHGTDAVVRQKLVELEKEIIMKMLKLRYKKLCRGISSKLIGGSKKSTSTEQKGSPRSSLSASSSSLSSSFSSSPSNNGEIKWEVRPGGMLVQKRQNSDSSSSTSTGELITLRVSTVSHLHHISIEATSTFAELKMMLALMINLEPKEQRVLFKGKEREDCEYLHMVGVRDKDKVLLLEDPAIKDKKLRLHQATLISSVHHFHHYPVSTSHHYCIEFN
ncbi:BAG family molecular chaperone regulator 2, partial [Linum grandiflorum]